MGGRDGPAAAVTIRERSTTRTDSLVNFRL